MAPAQSFLLDNWLRKFIPQDITDWSLIISNLGTIVLAIFAGWTVMTVLWGYWLQSVIIGFFTVVKIMIFGAKQNTQIEAETTEKGKKKTILLGSLAASGFFAFHYGFFHLVYAVFLGAFTFGGSQPFDLTAVVIMGAIFFANHLISTSVHLHKDLQSPGDAGKKISEYFTSPYLRIVPMHLTIIFGGLFLSSGIGGTFVMIFFLLLKSVLDYGGHRIQHANEGIQNHV
ncbi:MAG: hypothetical protein J4215_05465 [Candidatus Diapherotrites archaeon]|uniref:Uncharacterized protein n=1 Tax=Candidatus Iainarchaeum sp. TaxID=3101447 RepID=A0A8T4L7X4_9ARCH|nr:hypothetical protein [Candidatus Diapherotrites archaeon]